MRRKDEKLSQQMDPLSEGERQYFTEATHELELYSAYLGLSAVEQEAVHQGIDAATVGSFAPEEEMDEFYRLYRGA